MHRRADEREGNKSIQKNSRFFFCPILALLSAKIAENPRCGQDYVYLHVSQNRERRKV
jgi:hypothetical protein